jgi:hypothetical protein
MPATVRLQVSEEEQARNARYYNEADRAELRTQVQMVLLSVAGRGHHGSRRWCGPVVSTSVYTTSRWAGGPGRTTAQGLSVAAP